MSNPAGPPCNAPNVSSPGAQFLSRRTHRRRGGGFVASGRAGGPRKSQGRSRLRCPGASSLCARSPAEHPRCTATRRRTRPTPRSGSQPKRDAVDDKRGRRPRRPIPRARPFAQRKSVLPRLETPQPPSKERGRWSSIKVFRRRPTLPGSCPPSTIGAGGGHDRVRDGNGCGTSAMATGTLLREARACAEKAATQREEEGSAGAWGSRRDGRFRVTGGAIKASTDSYRSAQHVAVRTPPADQPGGLPGVLPC